MDNTLPAYIEQLELMAFFSGYPLLYFLTLFIAGEWRKKQFSYIKLLVKLLPFSYALTATLYMGMVLNEIIGNSEDEGFIALFHNPFLKIWGLLAVLFWFPFLNKRPVNSLLHSLLFFYLLLKDIYLYLVVSTNSSLIKNDMRMYTDSILLNAVTLGITFSAYLAWTFFTGNKKNNSP